MTRHDELRTISGVPLFFSDQAVFKGRALGIKMDHMHRFLRHNLVWPAVVLLLIGCDKKDSGTTAPQQSAIAQQTAPAIVSSAEATTSDPVASFKDFAAKFESKAAIFYSSATKTPLPSKIDVKKTDSLINPVIGILEMSFRDDDQFNHLGSYSIFTSTFTFTMQDRKWAISSASGEPKFFDKFGNLEPVGDDSDLKLPANLRAAVDRARTTTYPDRDTADHIAAEIQK